MSYLNHLTHKRYLTHKTDISYLLKDKIPSMYTVYNKLSAFSVMATELFRINPATKIIFQGCSSTETHASLDVQNVSQQRIIVKVRTTSPHKFTVSPHTTLVEPKASVTLNIILLPFVTRPGRTGSKTDKFLIQVC